MRTDLPSGTVTLLFSDIEGSTRLLGEIGVDAYAAALAEHRRIVREACRTNGGIEVDTQGDAFFVAFGSAQAAALAARTITQGLRAGPVRLRIGIHTGRPLLTDEGYIGPDVHLAARVAAAGHGGQILLTEPTCNLVASDGLVRPLGRHRLRDVGEPVALFQLGEGVFPPLRTISASHVPRPAGRFIGRVGELAVIAAHLARGVRLLTLTGPGGTGKTRLALEAAAAVLAADRTHVFWVGLAPLRDPTLVMPTIAQALGARVPVAEHIGDREMLLLLDNLEQVIDAAPELVALLSACPGLILLVTSRELLRVSGEVEYQVPPLDAGDAIALFVERSGQAPTADVAALCARLDHLPLAVELAAARSTALSPARILERLSSRLDLLTGGRATDPRQATLRATIDWSYDLLSGDEQGLFRRMAVFRSGTTLDAAEAIADADIDVLQSLVEKSLIRYSDERYRMLETIREYAAERLDQSPEGSGTHRRHAEWYTALVEHAEYELEGPDQDVWLDRLAAEHDNIRGALTWALAREDADLALRLAGSAATFWWVHGHWAEGQRWLETALSLPRPQDPSLRAKALEGAAHLALRRWDYRSTQRPADESLAIRREQDDARGIARSLRVLGLIASGHGDVDRFRTYTQESAAWARTAGDSWALAMALNNLGYIALTAGRVDEAGARFEEAIELAHNRGDRRSEAFFLENLGLALLDQGEIAPARRAFVASLRLAHRLGFIEVEGTDLVGLSAVLAAEGDARYAALLLGGAERVIERTGGGLDAVEERIRAETLARLTRELTLGQLEAVLLEGRSTPLETTVGLALDRASSSGPAEPYSL